VVGIGVAVVGAVVVGIVVMGAIVVGIVVVVAVWLWLGAAVAVWLWLGVAVAVWLAVKRRLLSNPLGWGGGTVLACPLAKGGHCKLAFYERAWAWGTPACLGRLQTAFTPVPENSLLARSAVPSKTNLGFLKLTCSSYVLS
jgi:hypothetical protein